MKRRRMLSYKNKKRMAVARIERISFYGKTKQEVRGLFSDYYRFECRNNGLCFVLNETWYGKRKTIALFFDQNKVEEKYIRTEYGKLPITKLYKNLSGYY